MQSTGVIGSLRALMGADPEVAEGFILAAVYCRAIRTGESPRNVADALFKALPSSDAWPPLCDALVGMLEEEGEPA